MDTPEEFWASVDRTGPAECWPWLGWRHRNGYGGVRWRRSSAYAHRIAYTLAIGAILPGMYVCHSCDNPSCCNPKHLRADTPKGNQQESLRKGRKGTTTHPERQVRGERQGSAKLTEPTVRKIREAYALGITQAKIAKATHVHRAHISRIVRREDWKHVTE
ncbi:MAG: HNH endonuclease [Ktedonobacterales bacterium]